ncbi:YgaP family membrane protein [Acidithiobacillus caldus]
MFWTKNMLPVERWLRLYFGLILIAIYFITPFPYKQWTWSGLLLILTAITGYCPIYAMLRKDSAAGTESKDP